MRAAALIVATLFGQGVCSAQSPEYAVKAAYLLNFARYIEWPYELERRRGRQMTICSWRSDSFEGATTELEKRYLGDLKVVFSTIQNSSDVENCDLLFFKSQTEPELTAMSALLESNHVVSVTENSLTGILNFEIVDGQVRFDCNLSIAQRTGVRLGSQLLKLALRVEGDTP